MAVKSEIQYFLGANSPTGFYSLYDQLLPPERAEKIFILKGGPGCGKSTLMRKIAAAAQKRDEAVEYILCSGDPASLDAIVLPQARTALVDGTAPHVVEPKYPGAVEHYLNLGECYDANELSSLRYDLQHCMTSYKESYQRAYRCLSAAAEIFTDIRVTLQTDALEEKAAKRAKGILSREGKPLKTNAPGDVKQRFLSAVTHRGHLCLFHTAFAQCDRIYELADSFGLSHVLLSHLLSGFTSYGYDVIACPNPMAPERLEHLLIPQLSLAFLTCAPNLPFPADSYRRIRMDSMADQTLLHRSRPRLRFYKKVFATLMEEAVSALSQAKEIHDDLEGIYHPHVNFQRVDEYVAKLLTELNLT